MQEKISAKVREMFDMLDKDGSGTVDSEEIRQVDCVACAWPLYLCVCVLGPCACLFLVLVRSLYLSVLMVWSSVMCPHTYEREREREQKERARDMCVCVCMC